MREVQSVAEFESLLGATGIALVVEFFSPTCVPCRVMLAKLEALSIEADDVPVRFVKVNVQSFPELAARFEVRSVPTVIVFKAGEIVQKFAGGNTSIAEIEAAIRRAVA